VITVPTVSAPTISAPVIPPPMIPPSVGPSLPAPPLAAPPVAVARPSSGPHAPAAPLAPSGRPNSGPFIPVGPAATSTIKPAASLEAPASAPTTTIKPASLEAPASAPTTTIKPSAVIRPSAVFQPSAVYQPSAVLQPSAVVMTGPRPAVVLPASAQTSNNYPPAQPLHPAFTPIPTQPPPLEQPLHPAFTPIPTQPPPLDPVPAAPVPIAADFEPAGTATFEPAPTRQPGGDPRPVNDDDETSASAERTLIAGSRAEVVDIDIADLDDPPARPAAPPEDIDDHLPTTTWTPPLFGVANEIIPLSPEAFHRLLPRFATVTARDEVTDLLLDFLAEGFSRVIMFTHIKGEIRGRDARGEDLMVEAVRQIRIPATGPSLFSGVIERRQPYFGAMRTDTAIDAAFYGALGGVDGMVLCLPVLMRDKVPLLVFASGSHNPVDPRSLQELTTEVSAALERLIVLDKSRQK
jgi:hypothetical protein